MYIQKVYVAVFLVCSDFLKMIRDSTYVFSFFIERMSPHLKESDF